MEKSSKVTQLILDREGFQFRPIGLQGSDLSLQAPLPEFLQMCSDIPAWASNW